MNKRSSDLHELVSENELVYVGQMGDSIPYHGHVKRVEDGALTIVGKGGNEYVFPSPVCHNNNGDWWRFPLYGRRISGLWWLRRYSWAFALCFVLGMICAELISIWKSG